MTKKHDKYGLPPGVAKALMAMWWKDSMQSGKVLGREPLPLRVVEFMQRQQLEIILLGGRAEHLEGRSRLLDELLGRYKIKHRQAREERNRWLQTDQELKKFRRLLNEIQDRTRKGDPPTAGEIGNGWNNIMDPEFQGHELLVKLPQSAAELTATVRSFRACSNCGETGHNARSCTKGKKTAKKAAPKKKK